jgi:hypothetical protein
MDPASEYKHRTGRTWRSLSKRESKSDRTDRKLRSLIKKNPRRGTRQGEHGEV